jgi:hypothetical protein
MLATQYDAFGATLAALKLPLDVWEWRHRSGKTGLEVDHVAGQAMEAFLQRLRRRRVRVHIAGQFVGGQVPLLRQRQLGQQLRDVMSDQASAEQLAVLAVGDQLDEPAGVNPCALAFAVNGNFATLTS